MWWVGALTSVLVCTIIPPVIFGEVCDEQDDGCDGLDTWKVVSRKNRSRLTPGGNISAYRTPF